MKYNSPNCDSCGAELKGKPYFTINIWHIFAKRKYPEKELNAAICTECYAESELFRKLLQNQSNGLSWMNSGVK